VGPILSCEDNIKIDPDELNYERMEMVEEIRHMFHLAHVDM